MSRQRALQPAATPAQQSQRDFDGPDLLTQVQVCARLGISDDTFMRWRKAGRAPEAVPLPSGRLKWRREDIDRLAGGSQSSGSPRRYFTTVRPVHGFMDAGRRLEQRHRTPILPPAAERGNPKTIAPQANCGRHER